MISLQNLLSQGLVNVDYPVRIRSAVEKAAASWRQFCALPMHIKKRFVYANKEGIDGDGYEFKDTPGNTNDQKENFHATLRAYDELARVADEVGNRDALAFIYGAQNIAKLASPLVLEFAQGVEEEFGLSGLADEVQLGKQNWFLRYLHYFGDRQAGQVIAAPHADKSGFTMHLYESSPGLQYLQYHSRRQWLPMPVSKGQTVIISNMQLQYKSNGQLMALCHRVLATQETQRDGRYSIVLFVPLVKTPMVDKNAKGRMQDFPPGFNYNMYSADFRQLFK